jgi:hypothetical protein
MYGQFFRVIYPSLLHVKLPLWTKACKQKQFMHFSFLSSKNFESIQNVTFEKRSLNTTTIEKSYRYLRILARATSKTKFTIHSIKMYHYFCKTTRMHNTVLSKQDSSTTNIIAIVQCGDNAVASNGNSTNITANCTPKGNWTFGDQKCVCVKGFQSNNQECSRK